VAYDYDPERNHGELKGATHIGHYGAKGEGPYITLYFSVFEGHIYNSSWQSNGCPSSIACARMTTRLVTGSSVEAAHRLEPEDLIVILGGLPPGKGECAKWAVTALRDALENKGDK
jgi:nitrogen fixation NifU-like protein